jgi:hypothetical protein
MPPHNETIQLLTDSMSLLKKGDDPEFDGLYISDTVLGIKKYDLGTPTCRNRQKTPLQAQ